MTTDIKFHKVPDVFSGQKSYGAQMQNGRTFMVIGDDIHGAMCWSVSTQMPGLPIEYLTNEFGYGTKEEAFAAVAQYLITKGEVPRQEPKE